MVGPWLTRIGPWLTRIGAALGILGLILWLIRYFANSFAPLAFLQFEPLSIRLLGWLFMLPFPLVVIGTGISADREKRLAGRWLLRIGAALGLLLLIGGLTHAIPEALIAMLGLVSFYLLVLGILIYLGLGWPVRKTSLEKRDRRSLKR
jgi:hypothetical protein